MNILLTAIGGPAGMSFAKSLREISGIRLVGTNLDEDALGKPFVDSFYTVPLGTDENYMDAIRRIISKERIDCVIPFVDEELFFLTKHGETLDAKVLASPHETILYTSDKSKTYEVAEEFLPKRRDANTGEFPLFAKLRVGRGGKGAKVIENKDELLSLPTDRYVFQEILRGPEVSIDALFDFTGELRAAVPRIRASIVHGISVKGIVFEHDTLLEIVRKLSKKMKFAGPINFQFMLGRDGYKLIEINARGSGGMGITIASGVDIPKLAYQLLTKSTLSEIPSPKVGTYKNFAEVLERQQKLV
ncbi:ATP-grasp domain-containing protein [Candidatus Parcubacteria bacterium]|nr:MAG: ATP-grasp domain-containing protein [Candidatus Parcubacteria bacterium]